MTLKLLTAMGNKREIKVGLMPALWKERENDENCVFNETVEMKDYVLLKICPNSELFI